MMGVLGSAVMSKFWGEVLLVFGLFGVSSIYFHYGGWVKSVSFFFEVDMVGGSLILLSLWVIFLSLLSSISIKSGLNFKHTFVFLMAIMMVCLVLSFSVNNYILFYISFEVCLVPIMLLVLGWGYQPERVEAGSYLLFYTLFGSLPLFYVLLKFNFLMGSSYMYWFDYSCGGLCFIFLVGAFLAKFPMYMVHLWLLKAHVEAPVAGSMVLAGILLKLGGYGLIRVLPLYDGSNMFISELIMVTSLLGALNMAILCLRHLDMKLLVASSSVVHMSLCIGSLFSFNETGYKGSVLMMLSHGLCSSCLFYMCNMVYERTGSRSLYINKGMLNLMPSMGLWWFLVISTNMASPPSINLLSEILMFISLVSWELKSMFLLAGISFFGAAYSLYLFSFSQHGLFNLGLSCFNSGSLTEYFIIFLHWAPMNFFIFSVVYLI
uniref:NADH-ubiquinone oxidoreductase chain 4 n=1 Tax=Jesogammarus hinumensis TaxID=378308 RepID=A0A891ZKL7_9CRUS|nr:NADH dehydrogenase subunit 4 [Jesogammarus hinumensis]QRN71584.1 NADH dehydrogenase subunit 4 [Jesogammarus hinumensis]